MNNIYLDIKKQLDSLRKENDELKKILKSFGYPDKKPNLEGDVEHWKQKYKSLMNEKVDLEREKNKLFKCSQKLIKILNSYNISFDTKDFIGIRNTDGTYLIPGSSGKDSGLDYSPFNNYF